MVEWRAIGDICYISDYVSNGSFASLRENVQYKSEPDYAVLIRFADYSNGFDESKFVYVDEQAFHFLSKSELKSGDIIMSNVGSCGLYFICPSMDRKMSLAPNSILIRSEYNRYLNHWFGSYQGVEDIKKITSKSAMPKFNKTEFKKIQVPIPSKEEVDRIVDILDTFTSSIENLKEQIALRRKQYEYYRDQLLDLEGKEGVEMKTLGEIGDVCMCKRIMKDQTSDKGDVPFYKIGTFGAKADAYISRELFEEYKSKYSYPALGEILISASGTIGRAIVFDGMDSYFQDSNIVWIANNEKKVTNRYLYYFYQIADWKTDGGTIKRLYNYNLKNTTIPVPSLQEQHRIVSILDTFEASIQNLEAQLAGREKQYEYYRNKLLTFE